MKNKKGIERDFVIGLILAIALLLLVIVFFPLVRERFVYYARLIGDLV